MPEPTKIQGGTFYPVGVGKNSNKDEQLMVPQAFVDPWKKIRDTFELPGTVVVSPYFPRGQES
jgi:hypothetical protein